MHCLIVLVLNIYTLLVAATAASDPHIEQPPLTHATVQLNQVMPLPQTDVNASSTSSNNNITAQQRYTAPQLSVVVQNTGFQPNTVISAVDTKIDTQGIGRRNALVQGTVDLEQLVQIGAILGQRIPDNSPASASVLANVMGVPTFKALLTTRKGLLGVSGVLALLFVGYDLTNSNLAVFDFKYFYEIRGLKGYYPYKAMQNGAIDEVLETGSSFVFMFPGLMISYGALCHDICKNRISTFVKRRYESLKGCCKSGCCKSKNSDLLCNTKNGCPITFSSCVLAMGGAAAATFKFYSFYQLIQYTGTSWGDKPQIFSYGCFLLSAFYTLFDNATTYIHPKIHQYFNRDDPITGSNRSTLLNITQNAITKWLVLPDPDRVQNYNQYFAPKAGDTNEKRFYRMLFFLFEFGKIDVLIQKPKEPRTRQVLRVMSAGATVAAGYFSFGLIQGGVQTVLDSALNFFGIDGYDKNITQKTASVFASFGSGLVMGIARSIGKATIQSYDAWAKHRDIDEVASSLYDSTSSGYTSHPKLRKYLTTYNQVSGALLGIPAAKSVFDISSTGSRYPAAIVVGITAGSLETLFLQRWMHRMVNVTDKMGFLKSKSDSVGIMSDYVIEFMRGFHLDVTQAQAKFVRDMYAMATSEGLRTQLWNRLEQNVNP